MESKVWKLNQNFRICHLVSPLPDPTSSTYERRPRESEGRGNETNAEGDVEVGKKQGAS